MESTKKKSFKMPHLLFLVLGLLMIMSLLTYIVPAGQFDEAGNYAALGQQTPVSPLQALYFIFTGLTNNGWLMGLLLVMGGCVGIILETKAMDNLLDWALYRLQDKGVYVLVPAMFFLMVIMGALIATDALIAIIPIGVLFAKKMKLDPICAVAMGLLAPLLGFGIGPLTVYMPQMMFEIPLYSGMGTRILILSFVSIIACLFTLRYAIKIKKNPEKSVMGTAWLDDLEDTGEALKEAKLNPRDLLILALFIGQYICIIYAMRVLGIGTEIMIAVQLPVAVICGLIAGMNFDTIGNVFARGTAGMAFVCVIIGMAGSMSVVMQTGNILPTIVNVLSMPLKSLPTGIAAVGVSIVVSLFNILLPSSSAKCALMIPIIRPLTEHLGITAQVAVQAFQGGDSITNIISPALAWTMTGLALAKVPYNKWVKWVAPLLMVILVIIWICIYALGQAGWTGL